LTANNGGSLKDFVPAMLKDFMGIGIDPHVDFAAKRVLGSPEHSRITIHFF